MRLWHPFAAQLAAAGLDFDEVVTTKADDALALTEARTKDYGCVVDVGGDGTVHEVANSLMCAGAPSGLGVLPCGSSGDFNKIMAPGDPVARNLSRVPPFLTGLGAYLGALALTMVRYPKLNVCIRLDAAPTARLRTAMTAVMNGISFSGSFKVTPEAKGDDGLLHLLMVDAVGRLGILGLVPLIMLGRHVGHPRILIEASEPMDLELDGELPLPPARRIAIEILPGALRVMG